MLSCVSPNTRWSDQKHDLMKERLATPLPRVQMGMYLLIRVFLAMLGTDGGPCCPAILLLLHLAEPICATVIHPFIAEVRHFGMNTGFCDI